MPKLSQLGGAVVDCVADLGDGVVIALQVCPQGITPQVIGDLLQNGSLDEGSASELSNEQQLAGIETLVDYVLVAVKGWDLTDDNDEVIPVTAENIRKIPMIVITKIMEAISETVSLSKQNATS